MRIIPDSCDWLLKYNFHYILWTWDGATGNMEQFNTLLAEFLSHMLKQNTDGDLNFWNTTNDCQ